MIFFSLGFVLRVLSLRTQRNCNLANLYDCNFYTDFAAYLN